MKKLLFTFLLLLAPTLAFAQVFTTHQGGTGLIDVASTSIPFGGPLVNLRLATSSAFNFNQYFLRLTVTNASTTYLTAATASTTALIVSGAGGTAGCATFSVNGTISNTGIACGTGSGGGSSPFATTTSTVAGQLDIYALNTTDIFNIGSNSTTTAKFYFDPNTVTANFGTPGTTGGQLTVNGSTTLQNFTAVNATTSAATTTALKVTNLTVGSISALLLGTSGLTSAYGGSNPCTNQVALSISGTGVITCTSITDAMLSSTFLKAYDPFTHGTQFGQSFSATSTLLHLTGSPVSLTASSTSYFDGPIIIGTSTVTTSIWGSAATSSFASGINLANGGCYAMGGTCLTAGAILGGSTEAVNWATVAVLAGTPTYSNGASGVGATLTEVGSGALSVDSNSPAANDRVLVKNQAAPAQNGIYVVTATGSGIASYILTRAGDYNTPTQITPGINTYVISGTANNDTTWAVGFTPPLVIGTNSLTYTESAATPGLTAYNAFTNPTLTSFATTSGMVINNASSTFVGSVTITGGATTTNATTTSLAITGTAASNCNGTNALTTSSTGIVQCTAQPQGTVTAVSIVTANGFAGSSGGGATPALTLTTTITGLLKGNGTAISAAALTDFPTQAANTVIGNLTGATAVPTAFSTTSLFAAGTNGQILGLSSGTWIPISTTTAGTGLAYTGSAFTLASIAANSVLGTIGPAGIPSAIASSSLITGTAGQVAWFSGTGLVIGTSTIFISTTGTGGNNVGIASTSPFAALSVGTGFASSTIVGAEYRYGKTGNIATSTATTIDCRTSNQIHWPLGTSATTLTLTGLTPGQTCRVIIENPTTAAGALTWAAAAGYTLLWPANTVPTQTTAANRNDIWSFLASQGSSTIQVMGAITSF